MRGGNRTKPSAALALHGSRVRPRHARRPSATQRVPCPPRDLTPVEQECWDYHAPLLAESRMLSLADRDALAAYCEAQAECAAIKAQQQDPDYRRVVISVVIDSAGNERIRQESNSLDVQRRHWMQTARMLRQQLGLDPLSRARTSVVAEPEEADPLASMVAPMRAVK